MAKHGLSTDQVSFAEVLFTLESLAKRVESENVAQALLKTHRHLESLYSTRVQSRDAGWTEYTGPLALAG